MENTPTHRSSKTAARLMAVAVGMPLLLGSMAYAQNDLIRNEIAKRTAKIVEADKLILKGRTAYRNGKYEKAVEHYRTALTNLPQGPIAAQRRHSYMTHYVQGAVEMAKKLRRQGRYDECRELLNDVLAQDPGNVLAKKQLEYLDDPIRTSPTLTYEHTKNIEKVRKLLYRGESYFNQGQFDHATKEYKEILRIDPYNKAARRGMERVNSAKSEYYRAAYDQTRAAMLMEVDKAWEIAVPPANMFTNPNTVTGNETVDNPALYNRRKLQRIMLDNVEFTQEMTVRQAINFLRQRSRELDNTETVASKKGLNFIIRDRAVKKEGGGLGEDDEDDLVDDTGSIADLKVGDLRLNNIPMEEALRQICQKTGLRYKVENYAIVILRATDLDATEMYTRSFRVPPDFKKLISDKADGGGGDGGDPFDDDGGGAAPVKTMKELLIAAGIPFPDNSTALFSGARATLTVRNTANNIDLVENLVNDIKDIKPKQIKLLSKFVEIKQENTDELGFDWIISPFGLTANSTFLSGGNIGNGTPRTNANFGNGPNGAVINGIPTIQNQNVSNIATGGLRSGDFAITRDSIDAFLNNPNRTSQNNSVAPGILSLTGLFTDGQVQMIMRGLAQKKGADVMNAPSIVARPSERAVIEIIREFIYPTEYDPPELPANVGGLGGNNNNNNNNQGQAAGFPVTPANPTAFETRNTGVSLEVEPALGEDGYTIELKFKPEIVEFEGFINYGSPIQAPATDALGNPITVTITENRIEMPVFSTRRVDTSLTIYDGHTVAVGGLMREDTQKVEDKVPILGDLPLVGRLFQTNAESHIKSNLIIFVTAQIIDATGQPIRGSGASIGTPGAPTDSNAAAGPLLPVISR